jgi:hypothetical protein
LLNHGVKAAAAVTPAATVAVITPDVAANASSSTAAAFPHGLRHMPVRLERRPGQLQILQAK